jgi:hypothetical protein
MKLNEKGQCPACKKKPRVYKSQRMLCCIRCERYYDLAGDQIENYNWKKNESGEWVEDYDANRQSQSPK